MFDNCQPTDQLLNSQLVMYIPPRNYPEVVSEPLAIEVILDERLALNGRQHANARLEAIANRKACLRSETDLVTSSAKLS